MEKIRPPYYPIIYVRGYAMTEGEIAATVATPYMGFNLGSTKVRQDWEGRVRRHIFESPLVRLMKDYGYRDVYADGREIEGRLPPRSIVIHRYYEQADRDLGRGEVPTIPEAAKALGELILRLREQVCDSNAEARAAFRVHLVAHSMGGLVCRCLLQNPGIGPEAIALVDRVFTYATPHNGIEMAGLNVPRFLGLWDMNNFNRKVMAGYLALDASDRVDTLDGKYDPDRFFCLVGTNHRDYDMSLALKGSSLLAGEMSDGLVRIENAAVRGAPRAFVHRSHSGPYGIVNSEEGYQNLVRFLFGDARVDGRLDVEALPLPPEIQKEYDRGGKVRASYYFEAAVAPRGATAYTLTERRVRTHSAVLRKFDELLRLENAGLERPRSPVLFSVFLDSARIESGITLVFSLDLAVSTTGYEIDGVLWNRQIPGEYLFRNTLTLRATSRRDGWTLRYNLCDDDQWGEGRGRKAGQEGEDFFIPLETKKGFRARLRLTPQRWA